MLTHDSTVPATLNYVRTGQGRPLVLLHGLGGSWRSWSPIVRALSAEREVIAVDLPGFGDTPPLRGPVSIASLADAVSAFLAEHGLTGVDIVGSSMGARLALELARRGEVGTTIALGPGGFWAGWQKAYFHLSIAASIRVVRLLQPVMPLLTGSPIGRSLLFAQLSARPWQLPSALTLSEMRSFAAARSFDPLLASLVNGPPQLGPTEPPRRPIVLVWGRQDWVCFTSQAKRALAAFPSARIVWLESCGHFPHWDLPEETARLILQVTR